MSHQSEFLHSLMSYYFVGVELMHTKSYIIQQILFNNITNNKNDQISFQTILMT